MPNITTNAAYQQIFSMAVEERSSSYQDLVSNNNALLAVMRRKGLWKTYSGPRIRETLQVGKQVAQWYSGYDQLLNPAIDLFNDAYYDPKMVVVPIILSMQEILNNQGDSQLMDVFDAYMEAAERSLEDTMDAGLFSDGTANGGKQITGLAAAIPIVTTSGEYGGLNRATATIWRTTTYDASGGAGSVSLSAIGTQVSSTTIRPMLNKIMTERTQRPRLRRPADHEPRTLRRLRCGDDRHPKADQRDVARQARLLGAGIYRRRQARRDRARRRHRLEHAGQHHVRHKHRQPAACGTIRTATSTACLTVRDRCRSTRTPSRNSLGGWVSSR